MVITNKPPIINTKIKLDANLIPKKLVINSKTLGNKVNKAKTKHIRYHIKEYLIDILFFRTNKVIIIAINSKKIKQQISRYESTASLDDWIKISSKLLKDNGALYIVYRTDRLSELIEIMKKYKLEIKRMRYVYSNIQKQSNLVLIKAVKGAGIFLKVEKPLIIYNMDGSYTEEIMQVYKNK